MMTDSTAIIIAVIAIVPSSLAAFVSFLALRKSKETHLLVNSRMTELLEITKKSSKAEGILEEKERT